MKTARSYLFLVSGTLAALALSSDPAFANNDTHAFDKAMQPVLASYLKVQTALAADSIDGVKAAAKSIIKAAAKVKTKGVTGEHVKHYKDLPTKIKKTAKALEKAKTIEEAREAFKKLSKPMAMWGTMSKPTDIDVMFCSMAKGSWLQKHGKVQNPYYGASMLACGEVVGGAHHGEKKATEHDHKKPMKHGQHGGH